MQDTLWMPLESEDVYVCCFELAAQWLLTVTMKSSEAWVLPSTPPPPLLSRYGPLFSWYGTQITQTYREGSILLFRFISFQGAARSSLMWLALSGKR